MDYLIKKKYQNIRYKILKFIKHPVHAYPFIQKFKNVRQYTVESTSLSILRDVDST